MFISFLMIYIFNELRIKTHLHLFDYRYCKHSYKLNMAFVNLFTIFERIVFIEKILFTYHGSIRKIIRFKLSIIETIRSNTTSLNSRAATVPSTFFYR